MYFLTRYFITQLLYITHLSAARTKTPHSSLSLSKTLSRKKISLNSLKNAWGGKPSSDLNPKSDRMNVDSDDEEDCYGDRSEVEDEDEDDTEDSFGNISSVHSRQKAVEALRAFTLAHIPTSSPPPFSLKEFPRSAQLLDIKSLSSARRGLPSVRDRTLLIALHRCNLLARLRNITFTEELELSGFGSKEDNVGKST